MMDDLWYNEYHTKNVKFSIKIDKQLHSEKSEYQRISVFKSKEFGNFLTLDGVMMFTERDEFIYHEMMVHVPMAVNPNIKNVLVIGAGDGGILRELNQYENIESIDLVEIDERVIEVSKQFLRKTSVGFDNPKANVYIDDGIKFIRKVHNKYDLIIVDSADAFGPGEVLFTNEFYGKCYSALTEDGIMVNQHESPFYKGEAVEMQRAHSKIAQNFPISKVYQAHIPTYPSGHWLFGFASKKYDPIEDVDGDLWEALNIKTKYYSKYLHLGAFYLPKYVEEMVKENE